MTSQENTLHPDIFALFAEQPTPEPKELPPFDLDRLVEQARVRLRQALERSVREHKAEMQARSQRYGSVPFGLRDSSVPSLTVNGTISVNGSIGSSMQFAPPDVCKIRHQTLWFFIVDKEQVPKWLQKFVVTNWVTL